MATSYAACRRAVLFGTRLCGPNRFGSRSISDVVKSNGKSVFRVDTLALVRRLEAEGVPPKEAEALTAAWTGVLNNSLEKIFDSLVSKAELEKYMMTHDSNMSKFRTEVTTSEAHNFSKLQHDLEKLRSDIDKMRSELKYETDKVTAGQRLDLNLEKGRLRDELNNESQEIANLSNKVDRGFQELRALFEAAKSDVLKYCIGAFVSISAVGLAAIRVLM